MPRSPGRAGGRWRKVRAQVLAESSTCYLCGMPVDKGLKYPQPMSASVDHVIPIAAGGDPLDPSGLRLTHLRCNLKKGSRVNRPVSKTSRKWY
jgi:5-methylcytosine-specific restriction endonuclease McrA